MKVSIAGVGIDEKNLGVMSILMGLLIIGWIVK